MCPANIYLCDWSFETCHYWDREPLSDSRWESSLQCAARINARCVPTIMTTFTTYTTVQPRLSGPRLSGTSIIRTSQRPKNTLPRMRRRRDRWSFVGVVIDWAMSYGLYRLALAKIDWPKYFSEHCWPWSYCIGIVYRLGIINQARNVGISVIRTFHLSGMAAIGRWTKGSG